MTTPLKNSHGIDCNSTLFHPLSPFLSPAQSPTQSTMSNTSNQLITQHLTSFSPEVLSGSGEPRYLGILPSQSTSDRVFVTIDTTPQRLMPEVMSDALSRPFPGKSYAPLGLDAFDVYRAATRRTAPLSESYPHIPYSESIHETPSAMITLRSVDPLEAPPPLNYKKSPYCCVPLPSITPGPDIPILDPVLAYPGWRSTQGEQINSHIQSVNTYHYHTCAPATHPEVESATILLPSGQGITVQASFQGHNFVTVGDVLDALDTLLLGKSSREMSLPEEGSHSNLEGSYGCLGGRTVLHSLRDQYVRAGLSRSEEGLDVWDLIIG